MSFRLTTLLCLTSLAACSHNTPAETAVNDPSYVNEPVQAKADPSMTPASAEGTARPVTPTPSTDEGPAAVRAPLVADTKGTSSNDYKSKPDTQAGTSTTSPAVQPDNTKVNKRDANSAALTPMDQSNDATSLKVTQQIRKALMSDSSLSFTAKNVKIITENGKVTLRGPVNTTQERDSIDAAARKVAGTMPVDNQIEVKK